MHDLAVQVRELDGVGVDKAEGADPGRGKVERCGRAEAAEADDQDLDRLVRGSQTVGGGPVWPCKPDETGAEFVKRGKGVMDRLTLAFVIASWPPIETEGTSIWRWYREVDRGWGGISKGDSSRGEFEDGGMVVGPYESLRAAGGDLAVEDGGAEAGSLITYKSLDGPTWEGGRELLIARTVAIEGVSDSPS